MLEVTAAGDRSNVASVLPVEAYTVNARDLLTDVDGRARNYDAAGNTLSVAALVGEPGSGTADTYDFLNRLIERRRGDGAVFRLEYDADGNRVGKQRWSTGGGSLLEETTYLVETLNPTGYAQVLAERTWTPTSLHTRTYTLGLDLIAQTRTDSTTVNVLHETFLYDGFGSVRGLTDDTGVQIATYTYDAWGRLLNPPASGQLATHYLYRGEQWDENLKLSYNRARYLDLDTGRFWTMGTYEGRNGEPLSLHKFLYANGNPVMAVDPSGRSGGAATLTPMAMVAMVIGLMAVAVVVQVPTYQPPVFATPDIGQIGALVGSLIQANSTASSLTRDIATTQTSRRRIGKQENCRAIIGQTSRRVLHAKVNHFTDAEIFAWDPDDDLLLEEAAADGRLGPLALPLGADRAAFYGALENANYLWLMSIMRRNCRIIDIGFDLSGRPDPLLYLSEREWVAGYLNRVEVYYPPSGLIPP